MEPKQPVLESTIDYVKIGINGKLELVCAHKFGYYEQIMTQLACNEVKGETLIIWTNLGFIDLPRQYIIVFELVSYVLSVPLNDGIMMYENKDISTLPAIHWGLMHEATALSGYFNKIEETHRAVKVFRPT